MSEVSAAELNVVKNDLTQLKTRVKTALEAIATALEARSNDDYMSKLYQIRSLISAI
jgi:hypothetical protein